jgi:hypothetical protein
MDERLPDLASDFQSPSVIFQIMESFLLSAHGFDSFCAESSGCFTCWQMKKKAKRRHQNGKPHVTSARKWLILIDEGPLRKKAISKRDRLLAKVEDARRQWERFQKDDKSAFAQWMAATFGHLMTQLRENYGLIQEKQDLIAEVEDEMDWGNAKSYRAAYARVIHQRANPPAEPPHREREPGASSFQSEDEDRGSPPPGQSDARAESEEEKLFRSFLQFVMGLSPEELTPAEYEQIYQEFRASELRDRRSRPVKQRPLPEKASAANRLKEIYRILVRRLHPDARQESQAETLSVWHEVQEAYQHGHVERLEVLLALTETESEIASEKTSLGQLRGLITALERDLGALKRSLNKARQDPAWDFGNKPNRDTLARKIQRELEGELTYQQRSLHEMEKQIQRWAAPVAKKPKPAPHPVRQNQVRPEKSFRSLLQKEFGF